LIRAEFILYVSNQSASRDFYRAALAAEPTLDVTGITEFELPGGATLGLMRETSIRRLLPGAFKQDSVIDPRAELYLVVEGVDEWHRRALDAGGRELSAPADRDWGHRVGYIADPDGHIVAFAEEQESA
jgi:catechol 2,3-dioxygenase-like lactoylglutathione lyase family enzyme